MSVEAIVVLGIVAIVIVLTAFTLVARPSEFRRDAPRPSRPSRRVGDRSVAVPPAPPTAFDEIPRVAPRWPIAALPSDSHSLQ